MFRQVSREKKQRIMHKNKFNKLCRSNKNIRSYGKKIDEKIKKTYTESNETIRNKQMKGRNMIKRGEEI